MPRFLTPSAIQGFRQALCDAAVQLFSEVGYDGFHMRELGKRMGVSPMTPYRYFRDKNEILDMVRMLAFSRLADQLEAAKLEEEELGCRNLALCSAYVHFALEEECHYRLMFDLGTAGKRRPDVPYPQEDRVRAVLEGHASQMAKLEPDSPLCKSIGQLVFAVLHGTVSLYLSGRLSGPLEKIAEANLNAINIGDISEPAIRLIPFDTASSAELNPVHRLSRRAGTVATDSAKGAMNGYSGRQ
jgi:AcrR family transcriptional regulator